MKKILTFIIFFVGVAFSCSYDFVDYSSKSSGQLNWYKWEKQIWNLKW